MHFYIWKTQKIKDGELSDGSNFSVCILASSYSAESEDKKFVTDDGWLSAVIRSVMSAVTALFPNIEPAE